MPAPKKFDLSKVDNTPIDAGVPTKFDLTKVPSISLDFTSNPKGEGLYQMTSNGTDFVGVPYSRVADASKVGYKIKDQDQLRYARDLNEAVMKQRREHPWTESHFAPAPGAGAPPPPGTPLPKATDFPESVSGDRSVTPAFWETVRQGVNNFGQPVENEKWRNFARRVGADLFGVADFPVQAVGALTDSLSDNPNVSAAGMEQLQQMLPPEMAVDRIQEFKNEWKDSKNAAMNNLAADVFALFLAHKLGKAASATTDLAKKSEFARNTIREQLDVPERTEKMVEKFGKESAAAREKLGKAETENAEALQKHEKAVKAAHVEHTEGLKQNIGENLQRGRTNLAAKAIPDARQGLLDQEKLQDDLYEKKIADAETKAKANDDAAWDTFRQSIAGKDEGDISKLQSVVEREKKNADPATSAIFGSILREGEEEEGAAGAKFDPQGRPIVNGEARKVEIQGKEIPTNHQHYDEFYEAIYGEKPPERPAPSPEAPVVVDGKEIGPDDPSYADYYERQNGSPPPVNGGGGTIAKFARLQRWYTFLSNQLYSGYGWMEAGKYNALTNVLHAIDDEMQSIAKNAGNVPDPADPTKTIAATKLLADARRIHTERMETFSDRPGEPATVASTVRKKISPRLAGAKEMAAWLAKVGRYDPSIPALAESLSKTRQALTELPSEKAARSLIKPAKEPPEYKKPEEPKLEDLTQEKYQLPDAKKAYEENVKALDEALHRYGKLGPWVFRLFVGGITEHALKGETSAFGGTLMTGQLGLMLVTRILRRGPVLEWLARPSAEDLKAFATLPPADAARLKEAFKVLAEDELRKNPKAKVKIAPAAATALGLQSIQQETLDQIKKQAEQLKPSAPPGPQSSVPKPVWTHVYDPERNQIVAV